MASRRDEALARQVRVHESTTMSCTVRDGLNLPAGSGERQKRLSALYVELTTGCKAPGLYGTNYRFGFDVNPEPLNFEPLNGYSKIGIAH